jgi:hypothetical protein
MARDRRVELTGHAEGAAAGGIRNMRHLAGELDVVGLDSAQILALVLDGLRESVRHYKPMSGPSGTNTFHVAD